eukprot:g1542.t1
MEAQNSGGWQKQNFNGDVAASAANSMMQLQAQRQPTRQNNISRRQRPSTTTVAARNPSGQMPGGATVRYPTGADALMGNEAARYSNASRTSIGHCIDQIHNSVKQRGKQCHRILDQLQFSQQAARLDALYELLPGIDPLAANNVLRYLQVNKNEIERLKIISSHSALGVRDMNRTPPPEFLKHMGVAPRSAGRSSTASRDSMSTGQGSVKEVMSPFPSRSSSPRAKSPRENLRSAPRPPRQGVTVHKLHEDDRNKKTERKQVMQANRAAATDNANKIFDDINNKVTVVTGRHSARPSYVDDIPVWRQHDPRSSLHAHDHERHQTMATAKLENGMKPVYKYFHPDSLGHENNYTKFRNYKKFHTDISKQVARSVKESIPRRGVQAQAQMFVRSRGSGNSMLV